MKKLFALSLLISMHAGAGTLVSVFKNDTAPLHLRYVGVFHNIIGDSEYLVTFGEGMKFRSYDVGYSFSSAPGSKSAGQDEDTRVQTEGVERDKAIKLTLTDGASKRKLFEGKYLLDNSADTKSRARQVDKAVEAEFDKYRGMSNPSSAAELRRIFRQLEQDFSFSEKPEELPTFDLQIEQNFGVEAPSPLLASASVSVRGRDVISKKFLKNGSSWYKDIIEASNALTSKLDDHIDVSKMTFASYSTSVKYQGLSPRLKKAIGKFLKVEVLEENGFECEDSVYTWTSATWILKDGSTVGYYPGTECD